jgi:sigma-B regulation protein RsbU (phosphoserine phosphatase)
VTDSPILVVDDIEWNRALIGTLLEEAGYTRISYAVDGVDALAKIAEETPDLVILDIMMPGLDGFEVCRRLRADRAYAGLPVLVQTALSGVEDRNRAFDAGTTDLVMKPLDRTELLARVNIHLENRALIRGLQTYRDRLEGELAVARSIFEHLLPAESTLAGLERASGVTIRSHMLRASELGGDIWGTVPLGSGRFGVYLLDMAGRGVSAALNICRLHTLVQELVGLGDSPARFLEELNRRADDLMIRGEHAAMIYGVVCTAADRFTYACAAAGPPLLLLPETGATLGDTSGLPLGVTSDATYEQHDLPFPPGSAVMLHSNAILDALDDRAASGSRQSLVELVTRPWSERDRTAVFPAITEALDEVVGNPPTDDHTLLWLARPGASPLDSAE